MSTFKYLLPLMVLVFTGCASKGKPIAESSQSRLTYKSSSYLALKELPRAKVKIPVTVYNFRDQTGQYKPQANVSSFSTAVTQGATAILTETLLQSDWFLPVEREGLQNLLTERKIIRAREKQLGKTLGSELPPLKTANYILEGGIISYDTNIQTGGKGLGFYGFSVGELYREDQVNIYLRLVDVSTGVVLASVSTSKTILSQEIRSGFFRYVSLHRLAEAEAGFTTNEPIYTCILQAIQKAVSSLVYEGVEKSIWNFKNPDDLNGKPFTKYQLEKKQTIKELDTFVEVEKK